MSGKSGDEEGGFSLKKSETKPPRKNGRPTLLKRGPLTHSEKMKRYHAKKKRENPSAKTLRKQQARAERINELAGKLLAMPDKKYGVIWADPEWKFEMRSERGMDRTADNHYATSDLELIKQRDVASIAADDSVLFLWATVPMLPQGIEVMTAWGFTYKSHIIWVKNRVGTGYWFRNQHELLLVGTKGNIPAPAQGHQWPSVLQAELREHSAKPDAFRQLAEHYFPNLPKIELNRRGPPRDGWDAWGAESIEAAA
jgi:N6-adenosine-specific RNA methylase IME4